ncbi:MAG TPA: metal-dependent transcriptional regulator, partial [Gemmatimonadaceae bacterium]|nr:metal-dependent transcriptional regulator [Gemmatimonadaceae bacterium]
MAKMSQAVEDYLKAIYQATEEDGRDATVQELARRLGVSKPSVSNMVKRLGGLGLVEAEPARGALLTRQGRVIALEVVRHHRLIEMFLVDALGMSWDEIHTEADVLEHHISEEVESRI